MAKVLINDSTLSAIGNAIRTRNGGSDTYKPSEMPQAILDIPADGYAVAPSAFVLTGNCSEFFEDTTANSSKTNQSAGNWLMTNLGKYFTTNDITNASMMFLENTTSEIPFDINLTRIPHDGNDGPPLTNCFKGCKKLIVAPKIFHSRSGLSFSDLSYMFYDCENLIDASPALTNMTWDSYPLATLNSNVKMQYMFYNCKKLRSIPEDIMKKMRFEDRGSNLTNYRLYMFHNCYCLDELRGVYLHISDNLTNFCQNTYRLKDFILCEINNSNRSSPSNTIDLSNYVGYAPSNVALTYYIGDGKEVKDDATYQALKNDPDWWSNDINYSRYDRGSAIRTIASLPDDSKYPGSCTIKFKGNAGALTDDGAINTMTEEEIAVATEKGWTVAFV